VKDDSSPLFERPAHLSPPGFHPGAGLAEKRSRQVITSGLEKQQIEWNDWKDI
jgi:hypothetical protein